ncbi:Catalase [Apis cerana cerana]|uniref:Catalase n=1 Tax=Apis cerana cerana TaxID=94128 RepID=A0A2A3EQS4_APICC|nr:Catalase [Apis cerana cerana]
MTDQGIKNLPVDKAAELSASTPDYAIQDLYNAIAKNQYPTWTFYIQVMTPTQAKSFKWNPFDLTKVWPHDEYPLIPVGKLVLNRNPENYFADIEQIAFDPAHMVPGIGASPDKMLQGRMFTYGDAHRHRLGPNNLQLPVNCPFKEISVINYQRDGQATINNQNGAPNYFPNSFGGPRECPAVAPPKYFVSGDVGRYDVDPKEDNYGQVTLFWRNVLDDKEKSRLVNNLVQNLSNASTFIVERAVKNFTEVDADLGLRLTEGLHNKGVLINRYNKTARL